jgi:hypothetical protein
MPIFSALTDVFQALKRVMRSVQALQARTCIQNLRLRHPLDAPFCKDIRGDQPLFILA